MALTGRIGTDDRGGYVELEPASPGDWARAHALRVAHEFAAAMIKVHGTTMPVTVSGGWDGSFPRVHVTARGPADRPREWARAVGEVVAVLWTATGWRVLSGVRFTREQS